MKSTADELALAQAPMAEKDLVIFILNGLSFEFKEISTGIKARESDISFEELHDKLTDYEVVIKQEDLGNISTVTAQNVQFSRRGRGNYSNRGGQFKGNYYNRNQSSYQRKKFIPQSSPTNFSTLKPICQLCEKPGHTAKTCRLNRPTQTDPTANHVMISRSKDTPHWIMDSGASHHVTADLNNLSLYSDYGGPDEITVADGAGLQINHIGSSVIATPTKKLTLSNVLHVPHMKHNLISVSQFCQTNKCSVEFFSSHFLVKDLSTRAPLVKGLSKGNLYALPS